MTFGPITTTLGDYIEVSPGKYVLSTIEFGDPVNYFQLSPGKHNSKTGLTTAAVTRVTEKDVSDATDQLAESVRRKCSVQLVMQVPYGYTASEVDFLATNISTFLTAETISLMLQGAS